MSSINLDSLISQFPEETEAVRRLASLIESSHDSGQAVHELTAQRLFDCAMPSSQRVLARILGCLSEQGVLRRIFRVESDSLGGIGDFDSLDSIPSIMHDWRTDREIEVRLDQVRLFYRIQPTEASQQC